jgi:cell division protein FtsI (penicillin-binding protein 3)
MGSTFKTFATSAAIEFAKIPLSEKFNVTTPLRRGGFTISDFHRENHPMGIPEIFINSSNIGTVQLAERVGTPQMKLFFDQLGLLSRQNLDGEVTAAPLVPNPWQDISTITAAYGHGIAVTPLHLVAATATIINNGHVTKPTLIKQPEGTKRENMSQQLISDDTSKTMRQLMRLVVSDGTGSKADINGFEVGGKTGTAEKTLGHGYAEKSLMSSFIGAFPMDDPQFVVVAFIDEPKGQKESYGFATGGWVAAPVVGQVIKEMSPLLGIRPKITHDLVQLRASMGLAPNKGL